MSRSSLEIVAAHYAASQRVDVKAMMADVAPTARWTEMAGFPCAGTWIGPEAIVRNVFEVLGRDWIDYRVDLETLIDGGDHVVGVGTYRATHRATGRPLAARVAHVWTVADGKVVAFEQFTDTLLVARAAGA
jgi:ketosteroid isomerase-like protein